MSAIDARFEAQKLAFAPLSFQAAKALRDLGILEQLDKHHESGLSVPELMERLKLSEYTISTLLEVAFSLNLVQLRSENQFVLTKIGQFILHDQMTKVNMDFVNDVCYEGAFHLQESFLSSKPHGLKAFGNWPVIYEGLAQLPEQVKKSWFTFDHYYSDLAFNEALDIVLRNQPLNIYDIGGNTGKGAIECLKKSPIAKVTICDLPGQLAVAKENLNDKGLLDRVVLHAINLLEADAELPRGADVVWMSQFLDCFSKEQIVSILQKVSRSIDERCEVFILEPFWDKQKYEAATFSLNHTSLYFTCMANGNSKMYSFNEMLNCINQSGLKLQAVYDNIGEHDYTLLKCLKA